MRRLPYELAEEREAKTKSRSLPPVVILKKSQFNDHWSTSRNSCYRPEKFSNQEIRNPFSRKRNASCVSNLIFSGPNVSRDGSADGIGRVRFSACAEKHYASS